MVDRGICELKTVSLYSTYDAWDLLGLGLSEVDSEFKRKLRARIGVSLSVSPRVRSGVRLRGRIRARTSIELYP